MWWGWSPWVAEPGDSHWTCVNHYTTLWSMCQDSCTNGGQTCADNCSRYAQQGDPLCMDGCVDDYKQCSAQCDADRDARAATCP